MKTKQQLIDIHKELHTSLDKLLGCYLMETEKTETNTSVMELVEWSFKQTKNPNCFKDN